MVELIHTEPPRAAPRRDRRNPLPREIAWLVGVKLVLLAAIYLLCFGPQHRVDPTLHIDTLLFSSVPR